MLASKLVISRMYNAVTTSHGLPCRFLGEIRRDPGPLFFPVMCFVWEWTFDTSIDSLCII